MVYHIYSLNILNYLSNEMSIDPVHFMRSNMVWLSVKSGITEQTTTIVKPLNYMEETDEFTFTVVTVQGPLKLTIPCGTPIMDIETVALSLSPLKGDVPATVSKDEPNEQNKDNRSEIATGMWRDQMLQFHSVGNIISFIKSLQ